MNYSALKGSHQGETILVCGCGNSMNEIGNLHEKYTTIGVNDLERLITPTYLVVLNDKGSFAPGRWEWVKNTKAKHVFTHIKTLDVPEEKKVIIKLGRHSGTDINKDQVDYTNNSPYVACIIANYLGAKRIGMIGCDFTPHHFFANTGEHVLSRRINNIKTEYRKLSAVLAENGVELFSLSATNKIGIPFCALT